MTGRKPKPSTEWRAWCKIVVQLGFFVEKLGRFAVFRAGLEGSRSSTREAAMTNKLSALLVRSIREVADSHGGELSDRELVERFAERGDAESFAALVHRHGAMVLGVCRRVLRHEQNAEDVFQAVFLVLSRKAGVLNRKEAVGSWLFGVARRLALRARQKERKRQERELSPVRPPVAMPTVRHANSSAGEPLDDLTLREVRTVLDEELAHLPERERGPLILCYLEGLTRDEAAARLGCPLGTLKSRLERGRALLEQRLLRRGLGLAAVLSTVGLTQDSTAAMSPALQSATVEAALAFTGRLAGRAVPPKAAVLAEGMLKPTLTGKFAIAAAVFLVVVACGFGAGLITSPADGNRSEAPTEPAAPPARAESKTDTSPPARLPAAAKQRPAKIPIAPPPTEKPVGNEKPVDKAAKEEPESLPTMVQGVAKAVDTKKGTLLVTLRSGEDTFAVANGAQIEIDGKPCELTQLPTGANVTLTGFVDSKTASRIQAGGRSYFGNMVKAVDPQKNTITIRDRDDETTLAVAKDAFINVDGKAAKLAAVPPGAFVNLNLAADQQTVLTLGADGPDVGGCGGSLVAAVDVQKRTITFDKKASPDVAGKTYSIAPEAFITINRNRTGTLAEIPVGCYVNLLLRVDRKTVGQVHAQGPSNFCDPGGSVVKAVDVEKGTITFDDRARPEIAGKTFTLAKDVNIVIDGKAGKLSAIPPGSLVDIRLWVDRQTVGSICTCGQPVPGIGVVKAVDAAKNTITVGDKTYPVAKDALIVIDGKTVRLAGVPVGVSVTLKLQVDGKTVGTIFHANP
jgi:RNA polymerase sigma factor (sigma-70 family)